MTDQGVRTGDVMDGLRLGMKLHDGSLEAVYEPGNGNHILRVQRAVTVSAWARKIWLLEGLRGGPDTVGLIRRTLLHLKAPPLPHPCFFQVFSACRCVTRPWRSRSLTWLARSAVSGAATAWLLPWVCRQVLPYPLLSDSAGMQILHH